MSRLMLHMHTDVVVAVLSEWIDMIDLLKFDTSISGKLRVTMLDIVATKYFVSTVDFTSLRGTNYFHCYEWLALRGIRVKDLCVPNSITTIVPHSVSLTG